MALFPLGILSAAGAGGGFESDYELITTEILGSAQSSITFSNLGDYSSTYKHLQIRASARISGSFPELWSKISINGTEADRYHRIDGNGSTVTSTNAAVGYVALFPANTNTANNFGGAVIDILDPYSTTKNKTIRASHGFTGTSNFVILSSTLRVSTSSTTSVTLTADASSTFMANSRFSIYGLKG